MGGGGGGLQTKKKTSVGGVWLFCWKNTIEVQLMAGASFLTLSFLNDFTNCPRKLCNSTVQGNKWKFQSQL